MKLTIDLDPDLLRTLEHVLTAAQAAATEAYSIAETDAGEVALGRLSVDLKAARAHVAAAVLNLDDYLRGV